MAYILPHTERFIEVFNRLKNANLLPSNAVIAQEIGMKSANILTEIRQGRQNIQIQYLQKFCEIYDIDFREIVGALDAEQEQSRQPNNSEKEKTTSLIPYYDGDLLAGSFNDTEDRHSKPLYFMDIPEFAGCVAFRVYSDSMSPLIKPGAIMFCRKITDWINLLEYGQVYAILLKDNRKFLKYIRKHVDTELFLLKSADPEQDDFEVPKEKIATVWVVEGWMNKKTQ